MAHDIAIVGIGETPGVRRSPKDVRALCVDAVQAALDDAGLHPRDVDGIVTEGQIMPGTVPHDWIAAQFGIEAGFSAVTSYGGAGIVCSALIAEQAIRAGLCHTVVSYFGVDWGTRPTGPYGFHDMYPGKLAFEKPYGFNAQAMFFALYANRYAATYGLAPEDLGVIAVGQRGNALRHGGAQASRPMTMDDYLASRMVTRPMKVADCCLITDGAGAFVMTTAERARDLRHRPVRLLGTGFATAPISGDDIITQKADLLSESGAAEGSRQAQARAGITLDDVDFLECYDCFTPSCLLQIEDMGFCAKGDGPAFLREKGIGIDGGFPLNTHGGLLSYSYRLGIEHMVEAVRQLRGHAGDAQVKDARIGMVSGLSPPDFGVAVLGV